ncbi:MAG: radical SAM family heme chaperone HemW [Erysipelothrix sp.]|nr:radical SAM family heme chaperone HemW [Erysipelothrix sp.]
MARALYIHIPFCNAICYYCDFARVINNADTVDQYLAVLKNDLDSRDLSHIETIYIGGGTPSALTLNQLEVLFTMIKPYTKNVIEYTIEINPESLTSEKAELMSAYGINRASLGMQVSQAHLLKVINRSHTNEEVEAAVNALHAAGINNISLDLMYGIPTQTLEDVKESLDVITSFKINHVSIYGLTIEPDSVFGKLGYKPAPDDLDADMYELAIDYLNSKGIKRYEIANFAISGKESLHNQVYWSYDDFVGVGLHASGKENNQRYTNTRNLKDYLAGDISPQVIKLSKEDQMFEFIMMNLRMKKGFDIKRFNQRFDEDFNSLYADVLSGLIRDGLLNLEDDNLSASDNGLNLLFYILEKFMR